MKYFICITLLTLVTARCGRKYYCSHLGERLINQSVNSLKAGILSVCWLLTPKAWHAVGTTGTKRLFSGEWECFPQGHTSLWLSVWSHDGKSQNWGTPELTWIPFCYVRGAGSLCCFSQMMAVGLLLALIWEHQWLNCNCPWGRLSYSPFSLQILLGKGHFED